MTGSFEVRLADVRVGAITTGSDGRLSFRFSEAYKNRVPRPVLSQSFEDDLDKTYRGRKPGQLPSFFANLVHEGRLRELYVRTFGIARDDDLGLLAAVGRDLPGAVSVHPSDEVPLEEGAPDSADPDLERVPEGFRFSLAGVQLKFSMLRQGDSFTLPAHDERGDWIVKMDAGAFPGVVQNELSMMTWAREAGFSVPLCEMVDADRLGPVAAYAQPDLKAFAIARYDRDEGSRIHQEDLAQVVGVEPDRRYQFTHEKMVNVLYRLLGPEAYDELVRRITFVVASGNNDAHLKNWSIVYLDGVTPTLAPVYDQLSTVAWPKFDRKLAFKLGGAAEFGRVDRVAFRKIASKVGVDPIRTERLVAETLERLRDAFRRIGPGLPLLPDHARALREHWTKVPLLREAGELP